MRNASADYFGCVFLGFWGCAFSLRVQCLINQVPLFGELNKSGSVVPMLEAVMAVVPADKLAVHFHDTYGQALANILVSLQVSQALIEE